MSFLAVDDLEVRLDGFTLRVDSLHLEQGDYLATLGPTGAGKSVFLHTIAGRHFAERGRIALDGRDIGGLPPERRGIGIVYQDYALFPHLSVFENIAYGLRVRLKDRAAVRARAEQAAEAFGIAHLLSKRPKFLSGGEQQRAALARAVVTRPHLLLMDEPFSALDPPTRRDLRRLVRELVAEAGITVIQVAHDLEDTWALADKTLVLENGAVQAFGPLNAVLGPPGVPFLRQVEGIRVVSGTVTGRHGGVTLVEAAGVPLATSDPAEAGAKVRLVLRPQDVTLHTARPAGASARNVLDCALTGIHSTGGTALVGLRCGELEFSALLTADAVESLALPGRGRAFATIKAVHLNIV